MIEHYCSPWIGTQNAIWEKVLHLGQKHCYGKGNIIIGGNDPVIEHLYYLHEGNLKYFGTNPEGDEKILWFLEKGNIFGEVPFFRKSPMKNFFVAVEECVVYTFSRHCFYSAILPHHHDLVANLFESMANKIRVVTIPASDLTSLSTRVCKVLMYVLARGEEHDEGGGTFTTQGITQHELACIIGVHRVTLNNVIAQLKREGILGHFSKNKLEIKDYARLLEYAEK